MCVQVQKRRVGPQRGGHRDFRRKATARRQRRPAVLGVCVLVATVAMVALSVRFPAPEWEPGGVQIVGAGTQAEVYGPPLPSDMVEGTSVQPSSIVVRIEESTEPTPEPVYVYCNTGGRNYHSQECKYVYEHTPRVTLREAVEASYTKCPYCNAPDSSAIFD